MKFDPALPDDRVNVSPRHPLREVAQLLAGLVVLVFALALLVGAAVDLLVPRLPRALESRLFAPEWFADADLLGDEADPRSPAVEEILERLLAGWADAPYAFRARVWREVDEPNALALPGGWILVTDGLLDRVGSENELAFVLGHELGHFRHRDHLRGLGRGVGLALVAGALGLGGLGGASDLAALVLELGQRRFDRDQERAADRFGLELVAATYGHVAGAADFFDRLEEGAPGLDARLASYFATHPLSEARRADLADYARQRGWPVRGALRAFR